MSSDLDRYASFDTMLFDRPAEHVLRVTLNRPEKLNAITPAMDYQLLALWPAIDADPATRAVIITGAGRGFCAGGEMAEMPTSLSDPLAFFCNYFERARALVSGIVGLRKPLISAINGPAVGAGLAIALLADISIASKTAKLIDGHLRLGVAAGDHAAMIWPILCGLAKAKYYLLTNDTLSGEEAERINLVSLAVEPDELTERAVAVAVKLAQSAPTALRMTKYILNHELRNRQTIFDLSAALEMVGFGSTEANEAIRAFQQCSQPVFSDKIDFW
jgi:enoyl-CoA hydratase